MILYQIYAYAIHMRTIIGANPCRFILAVTTKADRDAEGDFNRVDIHINDKFIQLDAGYDSTLKEFKFAIQDTPKEYVRR